MSRLKKNAISSDVYKQSFDYTKSRNKIIKKDITNEDLQNEYIQIDCEDCNGTGKLELPYGEEKCVNCKGTGKVWINVI